MHSKCIVCILADVPEWARKIGWHASAWSLVHTSKCWNCTIPLIHLAVVLLHLGHTVCVFTVELSTVGLYGEVYQTLL